MNTAQVSSESETAGARTVDMKLEVVVIPVSDVERAKRFYGGLGWRLDADFVVGDDVSGACRSRLPGSPSLGPLRHGDHVRPRPARQAGCIWSCRTSRQRAPSSPVAASTVSETFHRAGPGQPPIAAGRDPEGRSYCRFATFSDPDGNGWLLQEVTAAIARTRRRGRHDVRLVDRSRGSAATRRGRARRAREAHRRPARRELAGLVRRVHGGEQAGKPLPSERRRPGCRRPICRGRAPTT